MKKNLSILILMSLFLVHCSKSTPEKTGQIIPGSFAHTVYFWLKNPDSKTDRKAFETSLTKFINQSNNITTKHIGIPALTNREVIDNTYTYSLLLTFKDKATQDKYQEETAHKQFIKESQMLWNKVIVYDSENILN